MLEFLTTIPYGIEITAAIAAVLVALAIWLFRRHRNMVIVRSAPIDYSVLTITHWSQILGNKNTRYLVAGFALAILVDIMFVGLALLVYQIVMPAEAHWLLQIAAAAFGAIAGSFAAVPLFKNGRITVAPGQTAFVSLFNIPVGELGVGDAYIIPGIMSYKTADSQAFVVTPAAAEKFLTGNGVDVFALPSATVKIFDPLKAQTLKTDQGEIEVKKQLLSKTRNWVYGKYIVGMQLFGKIETLKPEEEYEFLQEIMGFKAKLANEGPEEIRVLVNSAIEQYGLKIDEGQVQITEVSLDQKIEEAIARIFEEIFQKIGLTNDARNKSAVVGELNKIFIEAGVDLKSMTDKDKLAEIVGSNLDRALAIENQAKVNVYQIRGTPPAGGMMLNPNPT